MAVQLSEGALLSIMNGNDVDQPVVQVLGHKKVASNGVNERYRLLVSDGVHVNSFVMLGTQFNEKVSNGEICDLSIVRINKYVISSISSGKGGNKLVLIILDLTVLAVSPVKIGDPVPLVDSSAEGQGQPQHDLGSLGSTPAGSGAVALNKVSPPGLASTSTSGISNTGMKQTQPVSALNPFQSRWVIKVRVVAKSNIRTWSNPRSEGKLFSMDFTDESGSIRATAFNEQCEKFYDMIELNKVYYVSRCQLKPANKKFTSIKHDFEIAFTNDTQVVPCLDSDSSIPQLSYDFVKLNIIKDLVIETFTDVIGICRSTSDIQTVITRATRKELKKREITLVDQTLASVTVTLWDTQAEEFDGSLQPVVAIRSARVSEFQGVKSLSLVSSSAMMLNPDIPEAHRLRGWYDSLPTNTHFDTPVKMDPNSGKLWTLKEARMNNVGTADDKPDYFSTEATIVFIQSNRAIYQACPQPDCQKKVIDLNNGMYRCEKCSREYPNFKYRLMLNVQIADWTGIQWVTMFQDQAETLLEATADEIGSHSGSSSFDMYFRKPLFQKYLLRLRAKTETFNNETRLRMAAVSIKKVDYRESCLRMIAELKQLTGVSVTPS